MLMKKFTLFVMMLVATVSMTFAQTAITAPEDVKPGKIYWLENGWLVQYGYSTLYYPSATETEAYKDKIWSSYVWQVNNDTADPNQQFTFVEYEGNLYMYNIGAQKFLSWSNDGAYLVDIPTSFVSFSTSTSSLAASYPWIVAFDGVKMIACYPQDGYEYSGYLYCSGSNPANDIYSWQIYEVGDFADVEALTATLAENMAVGKQQREEAMKALNDLAIEVDNFFLDIEFSYEDGSQITLQADNADAGNYLWCNDPETQEGHITNLIDNVLSRESFFHSRWNGTVDPKIPHWLQIDLEEPLQDFSFAYHTRIFDGSQDFPEAIEVQGSIDGNEFTTIASFDKLPQAVNARWESGLIEAGSEYKHLRFVVTASRTYFHMSEFYLYSGFKVSVNNEAYLPYKVQLKELWEMLETSDTMYDDTSLKVADIEAFIAEMTELYELIKNLVSGADDPLTIEYIEVVEGLLSAEGVGYPAEAPRAALKALVDAAKAKPTAQARLDLEKAVDEYISTEDITLPVDGSKYTLTFVTYAGRRNYMDYVDGLLYLVRDTLTTQGLPLPETAAFTCEDNGDGTFSFRTADDRYLTTPGGGSSAVEGTSGGVVDYKAAFTVVKMYPNGQCESDVTYEDLFGLIALSNGGTYMAPNSSGTTFYTGSLPHFMSSWTSAMAVEAYVVEEIGINEVIVENGNADGIYDLMGRKVETPAKGIYIVNGKKVLVK